MHLSRSSPFSARSGAMRPSTSPRQHQLSTRSSCSSQSTASSILPGMGPKSASGLPSRPRVTSNTRRAALGWSKRSDGKSTQDRKEDPSTRSITPMGLQSSLIGSSPAGLHLMVHRRLRTSHPRSVR
ncbi:hypothetical protein C8Q70DRAFT_167110 [Cubamyces menziesii]|nr:hypothetical protein C8Q70DRAFT_167110 [Cubamyces menziesii]